MLWCDNLIFGSIVCFLLHVLVFFLQKNNTYIKCGYIYVHVKMYMYMYLHADTVPFFLWELYTTMPTKMMITKKVITGKNTANNIAQVRDPRRKKTAMNVQAPKTLPKVVLWTLYNTSGHFGCQNNFAGMQNYEH